MAHAAARHGPSPSRVQAQHYRGATGQPSGPNPTLTLTLTPTNAPTNPYPNPYPDPYPNQLQASPRARVSAIAAAQPALINDTLRPHTAVQSSVQQQPSARADTPGQASPREIVAQPGLINDTRDMIDRHHKTMHQAFLAMDKAHAASRLPSPGPGPRISQQPTTPLPSVYSPCAAWVRASPICG